VFSRNALYKSTFYLLTYLLNDANESCRDDDRPAESHEERVIRLSAELDASQQTERRVLLHRLVEFHHVQIFDGYPSKYRPTDTHNTGYFSV